MLCADNLGRGAGISEINPVPVAKLAFFAFGPMLALGVPLIRCLVGEHASVESIARTEKHSENKILNGADR